MDQLRPIGIIPTQQNNNPQNNPTTVQVDPITANQQPAATKTVDFDNITQETNKFKVNIFTTDQSSDFLKTKTADAKPDSDMSNVNYMNPPPGQANGTTNFGSSAPGGGSIVKTRESLRAGIKAALMVVDYVVSFAAMKIAGDTSQYRHTPDASQKKLLEDVLVEYLYQKQSEMPMWLTLTFAIAGSYGIILAGAAKTRFDINKAKGSNQPLPIKQTPVYNPPKQTVPQNDMKKYQDIKPNVTPPKTSPTLQTETIYRDSGNGVLEARQAQVEQIQQQQTFAEILRQPVQPSSPFHKDPNIIAETPAELRDYVRRGIYPMYRRNAKGQTLKVQYDDNGQVKLPGKRSKVIRSHGK